MLLEFHHSSSLGAPGIPASARNGEEAVANRSWRTVVNIPQHKLVKDVTRGTSALKQSPIQHADARTQMFSDSNFEEGKK